MSRKLNALLSAYEAEKTTIAALLAECLEDVDYKRAHLFQKGLFQINQQLQTLYNLRDKQHNEKARLADNIARLQAKLPVAEDYMKFHLAEQLAEKQKKLIELQSLPQQQTLPGSVLREVWEKLATSELTGFTLVLHNQERLHCTIRLVRRTLILTIPEVQRHSAAYTLEKRQLRQLRRLGFRTYDRGDKLLLFAPYATPAETAAVQQLLARIAFDVFGFKKLNGETFVRYS